MDKILKKDSNIYIFKSKNEFFNNPYAINKDIKKFIDKKMQDSLYFLEKSYIEVGNNKLKIPLIDLTIGANLTPEQFKAELWNRVETLRQYAFEQKFTEPVFITLTPPTELKPLKQIKLKNNIYKLVDNPKFNGSVDYVKQSRDYISENWRRFLNQRVFKDIKTKYGQNVMYLKVFEPFLDGTAHCHILCFLPIDFKDRFVNLVKKYFKTRTDVKTKFKGDIGGVVAYLLKYALKTFKNSKTNELNDTAYWYIFYNIRRFSMSRNLLSLKIYRKINHDEEFRKLKDMTYKYKKKHFEIEVLANNLKLLNGAPKLYANDYKICTIFIRTIDKEDGGEYYKLAYERSTKIKIHLFTNPKSEAKDEQSLENFDLLKLQQKNQFNSTIKAIKKMKDYKLIEYYQEGLPSALMISNPLLLAFVENELFRRGLNYLTKEKRLHNIHKSEENYLRLYFLHKFIILFENIYLNKKDYKESYAYKVIQETYKAVDIA